MKQSVQQVKRKQASTVNKKKSNVTHLRPRVVSQSNHTRQSGDKWERQADEAVARIMSGEEGVSRILTPAPAASKKVPGSRGEPLPVNVRKELEAGFGANLKAVRIHRDAAANIETRKHKAKGIASGNHIYFSQGVFQPETSSGFELLLHETAHVLQQTARLNSEGSVSATDKIGSGEVQMKKTPGYWELVELHKPDKRHDKKEYDILKDKLGFIGLAIPSWERSPHFRNKLEIFVKNNLASIKNWPVSAQSLLYDCLKIGGKYELAMKILKQNNHAGVSNIETYHLSVDIFKKIMLEDKYGYIARTKIKIVKNELRKFLRSIRRYLFDPVEEKISKLYGVYGGKKETLQVRIEKMLNDGLDPKKKTPNEWVMYGMAHVNAIDKDRLSEIKKFKDAATDYAKTKRIAPIYMVKKKAEHLKRWGEIISKRRHPFSQYIGRNFEKLATDKLKVFKSAEMARNEWVEYFRQSGEENPLVRIRAVPGFHTEIGDLEKKVEKNVKELFLPGKQGERPPSSPEFAKRLVRVSNHFIKESQRLGKNHYRLFNAGKIDLLRSIYILQIILETLAHNILNVKGEVGSLTLSNKGSKQVKTVTSKELFKPIQQGKKSGVGAQTQYSLEERKYHWLSTADKFRWLAWGMGWKNLQRETESVLEARRESHSVLALLSDFEPESVRIDELIEDFSENLMIEGLEPFTAGQYVLFYELKYFKRLQKALIDKLPQSVEAHRKSIKKSVTAKEYNPIFNMVVKDVRKMDHPTRWVVRSHRVAIKKTDKKFSDILERHSKFKRFKKKKNEAGMELVWPNYYKGDVFVWTLPGLDKIIPIYRKINFLQTIVWLELRREKSFKKENELSDKLWLAKLRAATSRSIHEGGLSKKQLHDAMVLINKRLSRARDEGYEKLKPDLRRAISHHREVIVKKIISKRLQLYSKNNLKYYSEPAKAFLEIKGFSTRIQPKEDTNLQLAALILDITPELSDAFSNETRYDIITSWLGTLKLAQKVVSDSNKRNELKSILPPGERSDTWILLKTLSLDSVIKNFEKVQSNVQMKFGFRGYTNGEIYNVLYASPIKKGQEFFVDGDKYILKKVNLDFRYHPEYGQKPLPGDSGPSSYLPPKLLDRNGKRLDPPSQQLFVIQINGVDTPVKGTDTELLKKLSHVTAERGFQLSMENLEQVIETWANTMLDIMELIPGWGQLVTAGRVAAVIADFFVSGDYKSIKKLFSGEIFEVFNNLETKVKDALEPDVLLTFLLFGDPRLDKVLSSVPMSTGKESKRKRTSGSRKKGKFAVITKTINGIKKIGKSMLNLYRKLKNRVQVPVKNFSMYASSRPTIAFAFNLLANNINSFRKIRLPSESPDLEKIKERIKIEKGGLSSQVNDLLHSMQDFELPEKVVNMDPVVAALLDYFTTYLIKRLGVKAKAVVLLLDKTGIKRQVSMRLAKEIVEEFDFNEVWREEMKPDIQKYFNQARKELIERLNEVLAGSIFGDAFDKFDEPSDIAIPAKGNYFPGTDQETTTPKTQGYATSKHHMTPEPDTAQLPLIRGGISLPKETLDDAEARFGHDFDHVRLHRDKDALQITNSYGVDGITSGSHVYLRPGLDPTQGKGKHVFFHELAHVLQQTGSRPIDKKHSDKPVVGVKQHQGLTIDSSQEHAADRAARKALTGHTDIPLEFGRQIGFDWQPKLSFLTVSKLLRKLSSQKTVAHEVATVKGYKGKKGIKLPPKVMPVVKLITDKITGLKSGGVSIDSPRIFKDKDVFDRIKGRIAIKNSILYPVATQIAKQTEKESRSSTQNKKKKGGKKDKPERLFINVNTFVRKLERFILAESGISVSIVLNMEKVTDKSNAILLGKKSGNKQVNATKPIKEIKILHVHLPFIGTNADLWNIALDKSWKTPKKKKMARAELRTYLVEKGITVGIWPTRSNKYRFSSAVVKEINKRILEAQASKQKVTKLPPWREYVKTKQEDVKKGSLSPQVGLRLDLHGKNKKVGRGRESHHLTQFLLLEYFGNHKKNHPFKIGWTYPGLKPNKASASIQSFKNMQISSQLNANRGPGMPSILLASSTHKAKGLHITPKPDETGAARQSYTVHEVFTKELGKMAEFAALPASKGGFAKFNKYKKIKGDTAIENKIYTAMQNTYKWMHGEMRRGLKDQLPTLELEYYKALYELINGPSQEMKPAAQKAMASSLEKIPGKAATYNNEKMEKLGWKKRG